jgi:cytosine/adenosine deaminase-related metal-dependent hydrolase
VRVLLALPPIVPPLRYLTCFALHLHRILHSHFSYSWRRAPRKTTGLRVLQWLHSRGCPLTAKLVNIALHWGNLNLLRWALRNGAPLPAAVPTYQRLQEPAPAAWLKKYLASGKDPTLLTGRLW